MKKNHYIYTNIFAWALVFFLAGNYVFGWTTPTLDPPEGDLSAPLDMSSTAQTKTGDLIIDSLLKVGRYSSAPTGSTGALYYDTTANEFKGYKSASWDSLGGTAPVSSVFGRTGNVTAVSGDYSVGSITGAAPLASPTFTGTPTAPTAAAGTNTTQLATTAFATTALNLKAPLASPTFTGTVTAPQFVGGGAGLTGVSGIPYTLQTWCKTTDTYTGNLGGISGANAKCAAQCGTGFVFATIQAPVGEITGTYLLTTAALPTVPSLSYVKYINCGVDSWNGWNTYSTCTTWTTAGSAVTGACNTSASRCSALGANCYCNNTYALTCYKSESH